MGSKRTAMSFRRSDIFCLFVALAPLLARILDYVQGYAGGHFVVLLLPVAVVIYFAAIGLVLFEVIWLVKQVFARRFLARDGVVLAMAATVFIVSYILLSAVLPPPSVVFLRGFADRIERTVTLDGIEKIATVAKKHIPDGETVWFAKSSALGRFSENKPARDALSALPTFALLPPDFTISRSQGVVNLSWGGALTGHWGLRWTEGGLSRGDRDYAFKPLRENLAAYYTD